MKKLRWEAALVGVVALAATLAAAERTPLTWDEGDAFVRAERVAAWTRAVVVGPQKLKEGLKTNDAKSERKVDFNVSPERTDDGANRDGAPEKSTRLAQIAVEGGEKGASEPRERRERPRFGDVERAALEYFSRFDGRRALFSERAIEAGWPHAIYREGHPAGYSIAIASGRAFSLRFLPFLSEKAAFRFGPIFLFALSLAAVFYRVARNWGRFAAILAVVGIVSIPRVFGHAQLAGGDSLLISSWLLAWAFFDAALASKRGAVLLGGAVGASFCAKFSGFAILLPLTAAFVAALRTRRRVGTRVLGGARKLGEVEKMRKMENGGRVGNESKEGEDGRKEEKGKEDKGGKEGREENDEGKAPAKRRDGVGASIGRFALAAAVAAAVFFAANPPLWSRPLANVETFISLNLEREEFNIPIYFLGKFYSPTRPLPWWNGFFWLATTVPTTLLAFAALGSVATTFGRKREDGANRGNGQVGASGENAENNAIIASALGGEGELPTSALGDEGELATSALGDEGELATSALGGADELATSALGDEGELATSALGDADELRRRGRRSAALALAFAATLPLVRIIPGIPTHDGARLLIASFPFVAILAAFGASVLVERSGGRRRLGRLGRLEGLGGLEGRERNGGATARGRRGATSRLLTQAVVASAFAVGFVDLIRSAPQYLSFYNATLGGVVEAPRRGMEATYYWDAFDADAVAWLNAEIDAARADGRPVGVLFGAFSAQTLDYYRRWGTLATAETATISEPNALAARERFGFYVVQRRPSGWTALDLALFKTARPIYRKTVRNPLEFCPSAARREVVLLEIYDFRDVERVLTGTARSRKEEQASPTR